MKNFELEVTLIGFKSYDFVNDDTKERISGVKVNVALDNVSTENGGGGSVNVLNRPIEELSTFKGVKYPCKAIVNFSIDNLVAKPIINSIKPIQMR